MSKVTKPVIKKGATATEYTKITFKPDLKLFHMEKIDKDLLGVLYRRVYDIAGCLSGCKVFLNGERLHIKDFKSYTGMFVEALEKDQDPSDPAGTGPKQPVIIHEKINDRWEIAFAVSDGNFNQVSFVNSIATTSGGTHVQYIADQIVTKITEYIKKAKVPIKGFQVKNNMFLFINCLIENPAFTSQTKEQLTTRSSAFGSKCILPPEFLKKIMKTPILDRVRDIATRNADREIRKTDGDRSRRIKGLAKLEDANKAGTREGYKCTLVLTEGDSAMALAVAGLAVVGRDYYGCFPLRGKLLNVRDASHDQIMKNAEIQAIKQIMGLQHKKHYTDTKSLRYGHIMIMTDQDHDGSHIKGLIINFLETTFPGLLEIPGFLVEFITPIIKVSVMRNKKVAEVIPFYTMPEYEEWRETVGKTCTWKKKYYKGLGTSDSAEGREYFSLLDKHLKKFHALQSDDKPLIELAFSKKKADERKDWLRAFRPGTHLDPSLEVIPISEFINKELILFSIADNMRSIPSMLDGLKPGQRKVLFGCFKRNLNSEIKVAQLAGYISEHTGYHHGEQSLVQTIVNLAQDYVGSNNLYLLLPKGSFGSRAAGGKDSSAPRYIHTELNPITRKIFHPADENVYNYLEDDEATVEPEWYVPILPMILVNGAEGIGTGWSTNIPPYNPVDIIDNIRRLMNNEPMVPMMPWYRGWTGEITPIDSTKYRASGRIEQTSETTVEITELPPHTWTINMRDFLLNQLRDKKDNKSGWIEDFTEDHGLGIKFEIKLTKEEMEKSLKEGLLNRFKLTSNINLSNMVAFDPQNRIKKYSTPEEIISDFYFIRLEFYQKRKNFLSNQLHNQLTKLSEQARFVKMIIEKTLIVTNRKKVDIIADLERLDFPAFTKDGEPVFKPKLEVDEEESEEEDLPEDVEDPRKYKPNYDYLLGMSIWSLTRERYEKLLRDRDVKEEELNILLRKSPKDLWNEDLDVFLEKWQEFLEDDREQREALLPKKKGKGKGKGRTTGGKKKRKGVDSDDDDDDDFVISTKKKEPARAPSNRKKKKIEPIEDLEVDKDTKKEVKQKSVSPVDDSSKSSSSSTKSKVQTTLDSFAVKKDDESDNKKSSGGGSSSVKQESPKPKPRTKAFIIDDDDDEIDDVFNSFVEGYEQFKAATSGTKSDVKDEAISTSTTTVATKAPSIFGNSKFKSIFDSDDDGDDDLFNKSTKPKATYSKTTSSSTANTKKKTSSFFSDDEEDDDLVSDKKKTTVDDDKKATTKNKNNKRATSKSKATIISDSDDDDELSEITPSPTPPPPVEATTVAPATKKAATTKRASKKAAPKSKATVISDDEEDEDIVAPVKKTTKKKVAAPKSKATVISDEDDDDDAITEVVKKKKPAPKSKQNSKELLSLSDDDDNNGDESIQITTSSRRPRRTTRKAAPKKVLISDDEMFSNDDDDDEYDEYEE